MIDMEVALTSRADQLTRNTQALRLTGSDLADRLADLPDEKALSLISCGDGRFTARVRCEDGAEVLMASRRDPVVEAKRWAEALDGGDDAKHTVAVIGCGLGYHVAELLAQRRGGLVIVLEPSLAMVHAALRCHDFFAEIVARRLVFIVVEQRTDLFAPLTPHNTAVMLGTLLAPHPASTRAFPAACGELQTIFTEYLQFARTVLTTALTISAISCDNILKNLPYLLGWPDVAELKDAWRGRPGICVAAGPSLRKNMHLLKQMKGTAAILAVQTVLKPLLSAGIRPDFVTALDYSPLSRRFYEDLPDLDDVTLVADPKVHPVVPDSYPGPIRMFYNDFADRALAEMSLEHAPLQAGSTVAHLNYYLARHMGCDPIVLIGQDLGYGENIYYAPGAAIHAAWSPELNRFNSLELMEWQRIVRGRNTLRKVPAQDGGEVFADAQMFAYIQQFERDFAAAEVKVINATEGGARLAGAEEMPLAEVIERYCRAESASPLPPARRCPAAAERADEAVRCLRARLDELDRMEEICRRVLEPLQKMREVLDDPDRFNRLHIRMNKWRVKIDSLTEIYHMVADVTQVAELKRFQLDHAIARKDLDEVAERRDQLNRDIQYVSLLTDGIDILRESLHASIERLEAMA